MTSSHPPAIPLTIDALDADGAGVGSFIDGEVRRALHVAGALPGEEVEAVVEHRSPHRPEAWGRLVRVIHPSIGPSGGPSSERVAPSCAAYGRCGGCALQHLAYDSQLAYKRRLLLDELRRAGLAADEAFPVEDCVPSPMRLGWRDNSRLVAAREHGRVVLGAYAPRSHEVVDLRGCAVVEPVLERAARTLADEATRLGLSVYDERRATGLLRYVLLRANARGEVLALLVVARREEESPLPESPLMELARALRRAHPEVVGVVENLQPARGNVLIGDVEPDRVLDGEGALDEEVGEGALAVRLRLSARAFFQTNRAVAARLYRDVAEAALRSDKQASRTILDGYCGVGGIALTLARSAASSGFLDVEVLGIEENPAAVEAARAAAQRMHLAARFQAGDATALLVERAQAGQRCDVLVLDPPRAGCSPALLGALPALVRRRLLYVSCSPRTLARDLALLTRGVAHGFRVERVRPYDMMPHTPHVEALAVLTPG